MKKYKTATGKQVYANNIYDLPENERLNEKTRRKKTVEPEEKEID